eukprot:277607_1
MELRVGKYRLGRKIGGPAYFGRRTMFYSGKHINTGEEVVIKLESINTKHPTLAYEYKVYRILNNGINLFNGFENLRYIKDKNIINTVFGYIRQWSEKVLHNSNIPSLIYFICVHYYYRPRHFDKGILTIYQFGVEGDFNAMVMQMAGTSLEDLFNYCSRKFTLKTILMIADQMLQRIEYMHTANFIHRDITPRNFLIGLGHRGRNIIYIVDFSLSKRYRDPRTHKHIEYITGKSFRGTSRYASINCHLGIEESRRDDLESLGYVLMYFNKLGKLPWSGLKAKTKKEKYAKIAETKLSIPIEILCEGFPKEFEIYLNYCRSLKFTEQPDYQYLRKLFLDLFVKEGYHMDYKFDWSPPT